MDSKFGASQASLASSRSNTSTRKPLKRSASSYSSTSTIICPKWEWNSSKLLDLEQFRCKYQPDPTPEDEGEDINFFLASLNYGLQIQRGMWALPDEYKSDEPWDPKFDAPKKTTSQQGSRLGSGSVSSGSNTSTVANEAELEEKDYEEIIDSDDEDDDEDCVEALAALDSTLNKYDTVSTYMFEDHSPRSGRRRNSMESMYCVF